jgi:hypothetical protein
MPATLDRLQDARRRQGPIGRRGRWVMSFARLNLAELRAGEAQDITDDILAFVGSDAFPHVRMDMTREDLQRLQDDLRDVLRYVLDIIATGVPNPELHDIMDKALAGAQRVVAASQRLLAEGLSLRTLFHFWCVFELGSAGTKIRRCARCGGVFYRIRRQLFDSPRCAQAAKDRRRGRTGSGRSGRSRAPVPMTENPDGSVTMEPYVANAIRMGGGGTYKYKPKTRSTTRAARSSRR